jgi:hypothetical protein
MQISNGETGIPRLLPVTQHQFRYSEIEEESIAPSPSVIGGHRRRN